MDTVLITPRGTAFDFYEGLPSLTCAITRELLNEWLASALSGVFLIEARVVVSSLTLSYNTRQNGNADALSRGFRLPLGGGVKPGSASR